MENAAAMATASILDSRALLRLTGAECRDFLQGILTNDVRKVSPERAIYAALLTPQGKYLFDFTLAQAGDALLLDVDGGRRDDLIRRLTLYRLRAKVDIEPLGAEWAVAAIFGDDALDALDLAPEKGMAAALGDGVMFADPRLAALGARILAPRPTIEDMLKGRGIAVTDADAYDRHRIALGIPEGGHDLVVDSTLALEGNLDVLGAVDFDKGCFIGQELAARMHHRGRVRRRLYSLRFEGDAPEPGTPILKGEQKVGEVTSVAGDAGLGSLRVEEAESGGETLRAGGAVVHAQPLEAVHA